MEIIKFNVCATIFIGCFWVEGYIGKILPRWAVIPWTMTWYFVGFTFFAGVIIYGFLIVKKIDPLGDQTRNSLEQSDVVEAKTVPDYSRGWKAGRNSVLRKNKSGCVCKFDEDGETIIDLCGAHSDYMKRSTNP